MIKKFRIPLHPTRINLCVYIHEGLEDMKKGINEDLKENNIIDSLECENFVVHHEDLKNKDSYNPIIMAIHKDDLTLGVIVHESYHVISELFEDIKFKQEYHNDEFGAYMIEYIVEEMNKNVEDILIKDVVEDTSNAYIGKTSKQIIEGEKHKLLLPFVKEQLNKLDNEEITMSRFVEILNEEIK